uniref:Acidic phospholipase A2 homolog n=1 Tax=Bungarus fasciatus TaxID=8613 RepID=PA2HA_BUNFA|nr:RecName: Full=Acidic phospholipase A2 homolog; Short=svPLA2 homolog [Bungarus fasciatus]AAB24834.1 phospholipase A2 [Bungarus fasciatus=banded krait, venom, Peptide Mutant, 118 aa] [Bungarus fasciatus]
NMVQFKSMVQCTSTRPWLDYVDYGCNCDIGGTGTPLDELDRCCQTHANCYTEARKFPECAPYYKTYSYTCSGGTITCNADNDECAASVCNCDRTAALCFAGAPYNQNNFDVDLETRCQ